MRHVETYDPALAAIMKGEEQRQATTLTMIPSENHVSPAVRECCSSYLINKYSEGYPGKRYYQGDEFVDKVELLAIERAKALFNAEHANVQPLSGSPANHVVFQAFLQPGDTFMGFDLKAGGHLTHGSPVNFSGKHYRCVPYNVDPHTERIDMEKVREIALREKPKLIISGLTAYPRTIDFKRFQEIAEEVGAIHLADVSHIAGLIAAGKLPNPVPFTDVVMTTTHKTLRGPRGAILLCKQKHAAAIDKALFPGLQGGPHQHTTAAMALAFKEATSPEFKEYAQATVDNAKVLAEVFNKHGLRLVTGGTENHLLLIDLRSVGNGIGKEVAVALEQAGIVCNANTIPYDPSTPFKPSGLRLGTPALSTRGMRAAEMRQIGEWMVEVIKDRNNEALKQRIREEVRELCSKFPLP